jgi:hypothetical protein
MIYFLAFIAWLVLGTALGSLIGAVIKRGEAPE